MTTPAKFREQLSKSKLSSAFAELRRRAELRMRERHMDTDEERTAAETARLVQELEVHQIELEMQNEELLSAREASEAALEKFADLYDFAPVGYVTLDREGTIHEANFTLASLLGLDRSRLVKRRLDQFVVLVDRPAFHAFLQKVSTSKVREAGEVVLLKDDQSPVAVRLEGTIAASGEEYRVAVTDITERKRAEMDRLILSKLESTGILAGGIAHDFNNLLTVILLDLEQAQALASPGGDQAFFLEDAKKSVRTARGLTQQLITFAKGGAPVRKPTSLSAVIEESVRVALSGSRARCEFSLPDDLWLANVDGGQIGQVVRNLVLNAREAMPDGGVITLSAENVVVESPASSALPPAEYVRLRIVDRGVGIAHEVLPKIYDPYFSTKHRGTEKGTGLGLTICHAVIQKHGGAIAVTSEVGVGTTVELHLPASRSEPAKMPAPGKKSRPKIPAQHARILVMDDEESLRKLLGATLGRMGHEVKLVGDGQEAIDVYASALREGSPFDLVLLDLTVRAGLGGQEAMQALLKVDPTVKAIVMSGYANDPAVIEPQRHGFKGVLRKPFDGDEMGEVIARVLGPGSRGSDH